MFSFPQASLKPGKSLKLVKFILSVFSSLPKFSFSQRLVTLLSSRTSKTPVGHSTFLVLAQAQDLSHISPCSFFPPQLTWKAFMLFLFYLSFPLNFCGPCLKEMEEGEVFYAW